MDGEDDLLASSTSLGLSSVLTQAGVDPQAFANFFSHSGTGTPSSSRAHAIDQAEAEEGGYVDDVSDDGLPPEGADVAAARARERSLVKAEEEYLRRALAMQAQSQAKKVKVELEDPMDLVRRVWPAFQKGERLKMSEVFYDTPAARRAYEEGLMKRKRRKMVDVKDCEWPGGGKAFLMKQMQSRSTLRLLPLRSPSHKLVLNLYPKST